MKGRGECNVRQSLDLVRQCSTNIEYLSSLNMYSTANKMRISGIICKSVFLEAVFNEELC